MAVGDWNLVARIEKAWETGSRRKKPSEVIALHAVQSFVFYKSRAEQITPSILAVIGSDYNLKEEQLGKYLTKYQPIPSKDLLALLESTATEELIAGTNLDGAALPAMKLETGYLYVVSRSLRSGESKPSIVEQKLLGTL